MNALLPRGGAVRDMVAGALRAAVVLVQGDCMAAVGRGLAPLAGPWCRT
jgi:hypothetical protein